MVFLMPKCFIVTFGWNENVVINLTVRYSVNENDKFILILPLGYDDPRTRRALDTLKGFFVKYPLRVKIEERYIPIRNFSEGIISVLGTIMNAAKTGYDVYVNVSGGMRVLSLMTFSATIIARELAREKIEFTDLEIEGSRDYLPLSFPPLSLPDLKEAEREILETLLRKGKMSIDGLIGELEKSKATIYRNIKDLEKLKMVRTTKIDRKTFVEITKTGEVFLEIISRYRS